MTNYIFILINNFGYLGMFIGMVLEAVIIIIPSELAALIRNYNVFITYRGYL